MRQRDRCWEMEEWQLIKNKSWGERSDLGKSLGAIKRERDVEAKMKKCKERKEERERKRERPTLMTLIYCMICYH